MTSDAGLVGRGPRYADELTADMVWEIGHFLLPRLEQATRAQGSRWRDAERERWYERQLAHRDPESQG